MREFGRTGLKGSALGFAHGAGINYFDTAGAVRRCSKRLHRRRGGRIPEGRLRYARTPRLSARDPTQFFFAGWEQRGIRSSPQRLRSISERYVQSYGRVAAGCDEPSESRWREGSFLACVGLT